MTYVSLHTPHPKDAAQGYWPREKMIAMDRIATAKMLTHHPALASSDLRTAVMQVLRPRREEGPKITQESAESVLAELLDRCAALRPSETDLSPAELRRLCSATAKTIREAVAAKHGVTVMDLDSASRSRALTSARFEAMYLIAEQTIFSYPRIGRMFGGRDHTTVIHSIRRYAEIAGLPLPRGMQPRQSKGGANGRADAA